MRKKVLIIGGSGFIGKNIKLNNNNKEIFKTSRELNSSNTIYFDFSYENIFDIVKIFDTVVILGGNSSPQKIKKSKQSNIINNKIIKFIKYSSKYSHVIFLSSSSVYKGDLNRLIASKEKTSPLNIYGKLKSKIENSIYNRKNITILRLPKVYLNKKDLRKNLREIYSKFYFQPLKMSKLSKILDVIINNKVTGIHNIGGKIRNYAEFLNKKKKYKINDNEIKFPGLLKTSDKMLKLIEKYKLV